MGDARILKGGGVSILLDDGDQIVHDLTTVVLRNELTFNDAGPTYQAVKDAVTRMGAAYFQAVEPTSWQSDVALNHWKEWVAALDFASIYSQCLEAERDENPGAGR